ISDSLHCETERTATLAELIHEKTAGNPFFAIQFISVLADEGLLTFDHNAGRWAWDLDRINAKGYTDNVVDLLVEKLSRLSAETQKALQLFACIGNSAEDVLLETAYEGLGKSLHDALWDAVHAGLVFRSEGTYRFLHDRVQEAAYTLIPEAARSRAHLQIGRLLGSRTEPAEIEGRVFEIVNQLNRGSRLITSPDERKQVARLNFIAGRRARLSTAYASAIEYLTAGKELLTEQDWNENYELIFGIESQLAECELLTASMAAAEQRLSMLAGRAATVQDIAAVVRLRLTLFTTLDQMDRGVEVCLEYLRRGGTDWSPHPTPDQAQREYDRTWIKLGSRSIESIVDLPLMTDPDALAELEVLTEIVTPAEFTDENLLLLVICRMVNLSLEHGNSDGSCFAYVYLGMIAGERFGRYEIGGRFGQLGYDLVEKRGLRRFQARTYLSLADLVIPWTSHVRAARDLIRQAFDTADRIGDLTFAAYSCFSLNANLLATGDSLVDTHREAENSLEFAQRTRFGLVVDTITAQIYLIRTLRGLTSEFGCFNDAQFDELRFERRLAKDPHLAFAEGRYWIRKLQARFLAADYSSALQAAANAQRLLWTSRFTLFEGAEYEFYSALSHAAVWDSATAGQQEHHFKAVRDHYGQLGVWADNCPENFLTRVALVSAEIARIEGRDLDAMRLYEQSISSARENGFIHIEGVANEVAARFYAARGFETIAHAYLRNASYCYIRWGADGKVRQLDEFLPHHREEELLPHPTSVRHSRLDEVATRLIAGGGGSTIGASVEQLDLATVIKVSQTVSTEIVLEKLIDTLMCTAIEHAGAERGLLIRQREGEPRIEAEATIRGTSVIVRLREEAVRSASIQADVAGFAAEAPESIIHYVFRTQESLILEDAAAQNPFFSDPYLRRKQARSILCLPLINQAKLIGVLYLENNLTPHVFTPKRIAVLKLLASQAAISLENTRLYRDLEKREAKIRRLVDANIMGIFMSNFEGQIFEANEAFLEMVNYSREDLVSGRLNWKDLTPPEWRDLTEQNLAQLKATGILPPYEKEYYRNDGSRIPVLVGSAVLEEAQDEGVSFVLDLTEQKQAEDALRQSQVHLAETQAELAHVTRVTALGELTASIAHEINQPLAGMLTNANAGLRWLAGETPNLDEARIAIRRIVRDGTRASDVISRIRALFKKAAAARERVDINEMIQEVLAVTNSELQRNRISLRTEFARDLPMVIGDKVQLQQVILNLLVNSIEAMCGVSEGSRDLWVSSRNSLGITGEIGTNTALTESHCPSVLVAVRDSGPGLSPTQFKQVFDTYYTTKPQGMGMGLAISRSIIEAHNGRLWATANVPRGAVFQFTLPIESQDRS
ncbi:MAG: GAF domain-containing protein, partial [Verrucomicrobia bacterium]|nr:GAF domain-containing protein [Verrucomicrobiota bacterium]